MFLIDVEAAGAAAVPDCQCSSFSVQIILFCGSFLQPQNKKNKNKRKKKMKRRS